MNGYFFFLIIIGLFFEIVPEIIVFFLDSDNDHRLVENCLKVYAFSDTFSLGSNQ